MALGSLCSAGTTENGPGFGVNANFQNNLATFLLVITQSRSVHSLSRVRLCDPMGCSTPGLPVHLQLLELVQTHVHRVNDAISPAHPLSFLSLPVFNLSQLQGLFQGVSSSHQVPKYWSFSFSFSISPSNEYSGLISFRMDWLNLLSVQGTFKSLLQTTVQKH